MIDTRNEGVVKTMMMFYMMMKQNRQDLTLESKSFTSAQHAKRYLCCDYILFFAFGILNVIIVLQSAICNIKVQQYGTEVYFCSDKCFSKQRSQNSAPGRMACSKCGLSNLHLETDKSVYWETMNFCSELCVGMMH
jgi:hypothetical protein